jgi:hypothetical protein
MFCGSNRIGHRSEEDLAFPKGRQAMAGILPARPFFVP